MEQQFVGLDVSQAETAVCVVDAAGAVLWRGKCPSTPEAIAEALERRAPRAARVALETGPMSAWHWRRLRALGLPVVCVDARHAKAALAMRVNKMVRPGKGRVLGVLGGKLSARMGAFSSIRRTPPCLSAAWMFRCA